MVELHFVHDPCWIELDYRIKEVVDENMEVLLQLQ